MDAEHNMFIFHTNVRWLSKGNVTKQIFELREELKLFFEQHNKIEFCNWLNNKDWITRLAYLVDIFEHLNKLNLQMQRRCTNIIKYVDL